MEHLALVLSAVAGDIVCQQRIFRRGSTRKRVVAWILIWNRFPVIACEQPPVRRIEQFLFLMDVGAHVAGEILEGVSQVYTRFPALIAVRGFAQQREKFLSCTQRDYMIPGQFLCNGAGVWRFGCQQREYLLFGRMVMDILISSRVINMILKAE